MIWPRLRIRLQLVCACFDQPPLPTTTRHALKQQKHSTGLQQAITEQLARGEELRRKQHDMDATGGSDVEDSDSDEDSGREDGSEGGAGAGDGPRGLLSKLHDEEAPVLPEKARTQSHLDVASRYLLGVQ